jgi:hypothetical protein
MSQENERLTEEECNVIKEVADSYYENCCNEDCLAVARILRGLLERLGEKLECCDPSAPLEKCVMCGKIVHTCERDISVNNDYRCPVHQDGFEDDNGDWFCDSNCYRMKHGE